MIVEITLFALFLVFFFIGFYIIYRQVALVKKGEFNHRDRIQCAIYGFIFSMSVMLVMSMAFIFAVKTQDFWKTSPTPPPDINPFALLIPFTICLIYISVYPIIDFLYIALSRESDEGLTPFHKLISSKIVTRFKKKPIPTIMAITFYLSVFLLPPLVLTALGVPFLMIWLTWMIAYPLAILTFYGSKGYIAGISNAYYHIPDIKRTSFMGFESGKRSKELFFSNPGAYITLGLMLFVFVWAWISMIQTIGYFFTGTVGISVTMSSVFVFVTLAMGIIGYFTRFWSRKIKYRGIDIYFAAYLMAALGVNVFANFLIINFDKLTLTLNSWAITSQVVSNVKLYAWPAVIEEVVLILFTSYYFLARKNKFYENIRYSKITECGQSFDPVPLFNFIKNPSQKIQTHAENTLLLMFERIPLKTGIDLNAGKFKYSLLDGICDPHPRSKRICMQILKQLEKDAPEVVLSWIIEAIKSPNYDKSIPIARSLLEADLNLIKKIPINSILNLVYDSEWRLRYIGLQLFSRLYNLNKDIIKKLDVKKLIDDPDSKVQVEILNILENSSYSIPYESLINKIDHSNKGIRAAAIKNIKNLEVKKLNAQIISKFIPLLKDPTSSVRASIFEVFGKIGRFKKYHIPILPFLDGLTDIDEEVRTAAIFALEKYYEEESKALDLDEIINKIEPSNIEALKSILFLLGRLWKKNPEKILRTLLKFIKVDDSDLKESISNTLIDKYPSNPDLVFQNLCKIPDVSKFITKGIISKTIIKIAKTDPKKVIPNLFQSLKSENQDIVFNAVASLEGLIDDFPDEINLRQILIVLQEDVNEKIKNEATKIITKIAKIKPLSIKPVLDEIFQFINSQESSVKIPLSKSILEIAKMSPHLIPIKPVITLLSDQDSFIRESGAKILGYIGHLMIEDIIDPLINKALNDEEWNVREAAVSSIGNIIDHIEDKEPLIEKLVLLLDDKQGWVRRSVINILSGIEQIKASQIPYEKLLKSLSDDDSKVREASAGLLKIYSKQIDRIFDKIITLLEDESEDVRKSMINVTVEIIQDIGLETVLSRLLQNLSDEGSMKAQRSISVILGRTAKYENEKIKKRVIALLKIRCEMSQDPIICKTLNDLSKS